jgi:hypothetical protein
MKNEDKKMALYMREARTYLEPAYKLYADHEACVEAFEYDKTIELVAKLLDKYFNRT